MTSSTLVRRSVAVLAATGAAAALTFIPAGGADAAVKGMYQARGQASAQYTGSAAGGACDLAVPDSNDPESTEKDFDHGTRAASVNLDATYTSHLNTADTVRIKGHVDSKLTLKKHKKDLASFALGVGGNVSIHHSVTGSECSASGSVFGEMAVLFTEHKKGYLYLTRDTKKPNSIVEVVVENLKTQKLITFEIFSGAQSHATTRALLKPGQYALAEVEAGVQTSDSGSFLKSAQRTTKAKLTIHLSGVFKPSKH